jgi:D-lyxose ketol-isomerase
MIARSMVNTAQDTAIGMFRKAGVPIREDEKKGVAIVDFGLSRFPEEGMHLFTMVATSRYAAKALGLTPWQTEPEHWHPPVGEDPGKEETVRVLWGTLLFFIDGEDTMQQGRIPEGKEYAYTCRHELVMRPGDQITLKPNQKHWFQADGGGVVIYTFSSTARDVLDCFSDPAIQRATQIDENS